MCEEPLQLDNLVAQPRVAGLRQRTYALEALLDVVAVGDDQLELDRLEVVLRVGLRAEAAQHGDERIGLAQLAEDGRAQPGQVDDLDSGGSRLVGALDFGDRLETLVGDRGDANVFLPVGTGRHRGQGGEERRLTSPGKAYESDFERHLGEGTADLLPTAILVGKFERVCAGFVPTLQSR